MWDWVRMVGWSVDSALKSRRDHAQASPLTPTNSSKPPKMQLHMDRPNLPEEALAERREQ